MLTTQQTCLLETIQIRRELDGFSPTIAELAVYCKIKSTQTVHAELMRLRQKGYLMDGDGHRTLRLTKKGIRKVLVSKDK